MVHFWLRREYKAGEKRTPLTPQGAQSLLEKGHEVTVEKDPHRCFTLEEYEAIEGVVVVEGDTWRTAPKDVIVLGLKELPEDQQPLCHHHIYFAHCFKFQHGWTTILNQFRQGQGRLYDLEFLTDATGRRVAAFGRAAGFVGCALGLLQWAQQAHGTSLTGPLAYHHGFDQLVEYVKARLVGVPLPSMHVIGALGRCGRGAVECAERSGVRVIQKWDMAETAKGGPFPELLNSDILLNAILLNANDPPPAFVTPEMLKVASRKTTVLVDVSCDGTNPTNPVPLYAEGTTFFDPVIRTIAPSATEKAFDVIAIDHLPSLVPRESSEEFASALLPHLLAFDANETSGVWQRASALFDEKMIAAKL